ncbi:type IV pilus prepilin peptidase PilD [Herbaspirillum frisingense GSF30]|uniref:Prepilin leader peptidase/N-methyltransferase n=1 Tax=Herbaspirillum frisingense GSF30 TaxID=864073 RepID=A0AAI9IDE7_9BURK|nr:A24 family peptidase [Herbaspirillum frisingense]EOA03733.1 type IV pilus prepilin peptidase PilD [Herbaspirillum frisingense GSF30]
MFGLAHALFADTRFVISAAALGGLFIGSFLNVLIYRLPLMLEAAYAYPHEQESLGAGQLPSTPVAPLTLATPRSHCPACKRPVRPAENIPVLSYLFLRGRCAGCQARIPLRYPLIELGSALLAAGAAWHFGLTLQLAGALLLLWALTALFFIDLDHQILPDCLTLPLLWLGLLFNSFAAFVPLREAVWGAVAGYAALWSIFWIFRLFTGKDGMGYGDFKLLAALGAWLGWAPLLPVIVLASTGAAVVGLWQMRLRDVGREQTIAFGPYLAVAGAVALFGEMGRWTGNLMLI